MNQIKFLLIVLMLPNLTSAIEFRARKTVDTWYGSWYGWGGIKQDSGAIAEDETSIGFSYSRFRGGIEILYNTYWNQEFHLKDTTRFLISWKDIEFESDKISVTLGNFYYTLGQGLMLGMEPDESLQRKRLIEGIKVRTKLSWLELSQIWGVPYEIDRFQKKYQILNDTSDALFGFDISTPLFSSYGLSLSGRGLRLKTEDTLYTNLWGGDFEFKKDWVSWYIEMAQKSGWDRIDFEEQEGWGVYSSLDIYPMSYGLNLQFVNYDKLGVGDMTYRYNLMPILNRSGYSINNGRDEIGFQVTINKTIGEILFDFSHSEICTKDTTEWNKDKKINEYYLGMDFRDFNTSLKFLSLNGGVDPHFNERMELGGEICGSFKNIESALFLKKVRGITFIDTLSFFDAGLTIEVPIQEIFTVYASYTCRSKEIIEESPGTKWYGVGVKAEVLSKLFFDGWAGKEKGGLVCSGGVCRWIAPFEGFKLKLNVTL